MNTPLVIERLDDGERFILNDDGKTYSLARMKVDYPGHLIMQTPLEAFWDGYSFRVICWLNPDDEL